jgi:hypothetical protein
MDEQKELQTNSTPSQIPPSKPIPSGIPEDALGGLGLNPVHTVEEKPLEVTPDIDIPTLRTYKSDVNQTVNRDKISTAKILIAEQNRQRATQQKVSDASIKRPTNILVLFLSILLIVGALGGIGYFGYTKVVVKTFDAPSLPSSFLFVFDEQKFVDSSKEKNEIYQDVQSHIDSLVQSKNNTYTDIVFYKTDLETKEKNRIIASEFFKLYDISLPTNIARSIGKDLVYGMYKTEDNVEPFVVVSVLDYESAYSSMFQWETTLALDMQALFPVLKDLFDLTKNKTQSKEQVLATTTATSTLNSTSTQTSKTQATNSSSTVEQIVPPEQDTQQDTINRTIRFVDTIFANKDARAVRDPKGTPFFYYAFIDKTKILFAQDPALLGEISRKIKEKSLVR